MTIERISDGAERKLTESVRQVIGHTNSGMAPDDAIVKVAQASSYNADFTARMVEMYNVSRTLAHLKQASEAERVADFPIANLENVIGKMFGNQPAEKAASCRIPAGLMAIGAAETTQQTVKAASAVAPCLDAKMERVLLKRADAQREITELKTARETWDQQRVEQLQKVAQYFRTHGHEPFEHVDTTMKTVFGKAGAALMDVVWHAAQCQSLREKRGGASTQPMLVDMNLMPYSAIGQYFEASKQMAKVGHEIETKTAALKEADTKLHNLLVKASFDLGALGKTVTDPFDPEVSGQKALTKALAQATDPLHENRIKGIKTESMLQDLIASDPVVSKYDPSDVVEAFNDLSRAAPSSAQQPAVLRGMLRKYLESAPTIKGRVLEGFEAGQLMDIENKMRGSSGTMKDMFEVLKG
jgi:hypothetical protein